MAGVAADSVSLPSYYSPVGGTPASIMQRAGLGGAGSTFYAQLDGGGCGRRAGNCYSIPTGSANSWAYPFVDAGLPNEIPMGDCGSASVVYSGASGFMPGDLQSFY